MKFRQKYQITEDAELLKQYKDTDDKLAFAELYTRHTHMVFLVCMKYLKDEQSSRDACMQIFESLLDKLKKHEPDNFKSWLYIVTKNYCMQVFRNMKLDVRNQGTLEKIGKTFVENSQDLRLEKEEQEAKLINLEKAMEELGKEQSSCLTYFYIENKSYQEIAEITGFDLNKVKSYIQNGKRNLKILMESKNANVLFLLWYFTLHVYSNLNWIS